MARLTRAQQQARTRRSVLTAAEAEFIEFGYAAATVDRIADRAELTRGAVYSNFPGKRALYLAVLVDLVGRDTPAWSDAVPGSVSAALSGFARVWLERLPLVGDGAAGGRLRLRSLLGVIDDDRDRAVLAELARLEALLLAIGLEACAPAATRPRRVRLAELTLTMLGGSRLLAEVAPGFGDPFDRTRAVAQLAALELNDEWAPAYLPFVGPAERAVIDWEPPAGRIDLLTGADIDLQADGVVVVLGPTRLSAAEEAFRATDSGQQVTVVCAGPADVGDLVRLRIGDLVAGLRAVFPPWPWARLRLLVDDENRVAAGLGLDGVGDATEAAVRIADRRIVARAAGRGAGHAVASATTEPTARRPR